MTTMELDVRRAEIIRQLFDTDNMAVLDSVKRSLSRALHRESKKAAAAVEENLTPYTMEELNARIDKAEENIASGNVYTNEEVMQEMKREFPWLR